jgi:hypothetical protein
MLANISVGHNTNTNILETIQTFTAAWKNVYFCHNSEMPSQDKHLAARKM